MNKQVYMQNGKALGTDVELRLVTSQLKEAEDLFGLLWQEIYFFENHFSRFKIDSEITNLNENAGRIVHISPELKKILEVSKQFSFLTGNLFNPFILPELQRSGYVHSMTEISEASPDYSNRKVVDGKFLEIGDDWARIPSDTAIDIGGMGKGYLADQLAALLNDKVDDYCLSLGGDIIFKGLNVDKEWEIDIQSNRDRDKNIASLRGHGGKEGVATSALVRIKNNKKQMHLINSSSSAQQELYEMCSVVAKDAVTADVMASCILIAGENFARDLIRQDIIKAVLLQGKPATPPVLLGGVFKPYA